LRYENRIQNPIVVPVHNNTVIRVKAVGDQYVDVISWRASYIPGKIAAMTEPEPTFFTVIPALGSSDENLGGQFLLRLTSAAEVLLGKTIEITIVQDHSATWGDVLLDKRAKWAGYGTFWQGAQESEVLTIEIPKSPETVSCLGPLD